jgi:hypothetical protein
MIRPEKLHGGIINVVVVSKMGGGIVKTIFRGNSVSSPTSLFTTKHLIRHVEFTSSRPIDGIDGDP